MRSSVLQRLRRRLKPWLRFMPRWANRQIHFAVAHRRFANVRRPTTFSEKVQWRILRDRRALIALTCDKLLAREYARSCAPTIDFAATLWTGRDIALLPLAELPDDWVLKPNHRSNLIHFHRRASDGEPLVATLRAATKGWLDDVQGRVQAEWAYTTARRCLMVEEFLSNGDGQAPTDYKFFVFQGSVRYIQVDSDRFTDHCRAIYDRNWELMPFGIKFPRPIAEVPPPPRLPDLIAYAEAIGRNFDFIRVDLYVVGDRVLFGELTPYPGGGLERFQPGDWDARFGELWLLPSNG